MVKSFSLANLERPELFSTIVRAASKLSIEELAMVTGGTQEDADTIIRVSVHPSPFFKPDANLVSVR